MLRANDKRKWMSRHGHNYHFLDLWNFIDHFFHIPREGRFFAGFFGIPHIRFASDDAAETVLVHLSNIPRQQPAVSG